MNPPILVFDDECPFCSFLAELIYKWVGDEVVVVASSAFPYQSYDITAEQVEGHPHYIYEGTVHIDHEAVSHTLSHLPLCGWFKWRIFQLIWKLVYWSLKKIKYHFPPRRIPK